MQSNLTELKSFGSPPAIVVNVTAAVMVLLAKKGKIPKDRSWKACKVHFFLLFPILKFNLIQLTNMRMNENRMEHLK